MPDTPEYTTRVLDDDASVSIMAIKEPGDVVEIKTLIEGQFRHMSFVVAANEEGEIALISTKQWTVAQAVRALTDLALVLSDNEGE